MNTIKPYKRQSYIIIYFIKSYFCLMTLDFFITKNPYAAYHSGYSGMESGIYSSSYVISCQYLLLISALLAIVIAKYIYIYISRLNVLLILLMGISNIVAGTLWSHPINYIYNSLILIFTSSIAYVTVKNQEVKINEKFMLSCGNIISILALFGTLIAIVRPNVWGYFSFSFNRLTRGELTYWRVLGLYVIAAPLALIIYEFVHKKKYIIFAGLIWLVCLAQSTRILAVVSLMPFVCYLIIRQKDYKKFIAIIIMVGALLVFKDKIISFLTLGVGVTLSEESTSFILNGRYELWNYYIEKIILHPLIGNGPNFMTKYNDYVYHATSEVGILKWFAEYGMIYGGILMFMSIKALVRSIKILREKKSTITDLFMAYIFIAQLVSLPQSFARILSFTDFLYWISMIYLNYRGRKKFDKVYPIVFRIKY